MNQLLAIAPKPGLQYNQEFRMSCQYLISERYKLNDCMKHFTLTEIRITQNIHQQAPVLNLHTQVTTKSKQHCRGHLTYQTLKSIKPSSETTATAITH